MHSKVQKWGNSLALRIPKAFALEVGLSEDAPVEVSVRQGHLVVAPVRSPTYSCLRNLEASFLVSSAWTCRPDETLDRWTTGRWRKCAGSLSGA